MSLILLAWAAQGLAVGTRVEGSPSGTQWQACTIIGEQRQANGYAIRCEDGGEYFVGYHRVRPASASAAGGARTSGATQGPSAGGSFPIGAAVEARPFGGDRWYPCTILEGPHDGGYGLRCEDGDYFTGIANVRAPTGLAPSSSRPSAQPPAPRSTTPPPVPRTTGGGSLPIGRTLKCYYLAGTTLNYSFVDITFTGASTYRDRTGASGSYTMSGGNIRFTSGPFARHRAETRPGGIALFAPNASFGMSCT